MEMKTRMDRIQKTRDGQVDSEVSENAIQLKDRTHETCEILKRLNSIIGTSLYLVHLNLSISACADVCYLQRSPSIRRVSDSLPRADSRGCTENANRIDA